MQRAPNKNALRFLRAKNVFVCQRTLRAYVLTYQRALRAYVLFRLKKREYRWDAPAYAEICLL